MRRSGCTTCKAKRSETFFQEQQRGSFAQRPTRELAAASATERDSSGSHAADKASKWWQARGHGRLILGSQEQRGAREPEAEVTWA